MYRTRRPYRYYDRYYDYYDRYPYNSYYNSQYQNVNQNLLNYGYMSNVNQIANLYQSMRDLYKPRY